jgi:hypothetical protein
MPYCEQQNNPYLPNLCQTLFGIVLWIPLFVIAAEQSNPIETTQPVTTIPNQQPLPPALLPDDLGEIDASRDYVSKEFITLVKDIDRFFGGERNFQETNNSVLQLEFLRMLGATTNNQSVFAGRVKLTLPATEKNLHLLIETDPDKQATSVQSQGQSVLVNPNAPNKPESYSAALRYENAKQVESSWYYSNDAGLTFQGIQSRPFARARGSYSIPLDEWRFKATESVFWFYTTGIGESSQLDFERPIGESVMFRTSSSVTWLNDSQSFDARQEFSGYHTLEDRRAVLYQASLVGSSQPQWQVSDYVLLLLYRQRLHRTWAYFEISPQLHFPKTYGYRTSPQLMLRMELLFDESR